MNKEELLELEKNLKMYFNGNKKSYLKALLRSVGIEQNELYYKTGYHFSDVKTIEDLLDIRNTLERYYYVSNNF